MYIISFKKAFGLYLDCNIANSPILKTCSTVDPRFNKMKCLNDNDRANINKCLINAIITNLKLKKINYEIYIADRKATTGIGKAFSAPQHHHWYAATRFDFPGG